MRTYLFIALIAFAIQGVAPCALADSPQPRQLLARSMTDERPALSNTDRQWLNHRQVLRLGTSAPDYPPLDINISESDYEGLTADYAGLLGDMLNVRIEVLRFASRAEAIDALRAGRIDLLGSSNTFEIADADLVLSQPYADDQSVIVTPVGKTRNATDPLDGLDLAMVDHYLPRADVQALYPKARLHLYPSIQDALAAVAFGRADAYLGDAISSDYLISKNFQGSVQLSHFIKQEHKAYSFALKRDNLTLQRVIDSALQGIGDSDRLSILRRWSGGSTSMLLSRTALEFNADEQRWMSSHPVVRVVINDSYAPLTFYDDDHRFRGITADVLEQVSLRTGLRFEVSVAGSVQEMIEQVLQGKADMIGALSRSNARQHDLGFTRPYLANSYVLVGSTRDDSPDSLEQLQGKRLAVIRGTPLAHELAQHHPQVQRIEAEDALDAMEMVVRNRADAALNTQISANYFVSRLFKDRLRIVSTVGNTPATSAFATAANSTQLLSILDKTLLSIPPDEMTQLANRWRTNAVISDSLWRNYRTLILQIVIGAGLLVLAFVIWNGYLRKLIKERAQAEQALENQLEFMRVLIDGTPHPLYVRDRQGLLLICNNSYLEAFGVSRESVLGKEVTAQVLRDPQEAAAYRADYLRVMEQGTPLLRDSEFHIGAQGQAHTLYHWLLPYRDTQGTVQGVIGGWIDISERKRLLEELHVAKDRADDASRAKTTFLATMSHEIRTPMNAVIGMLEIALKKADQGQLDRFALQVAFDSAKGLLELIGDILDIVRIESGYMSLNPVPADLPRLIEATARVFEGNARHKGLRLALDIQPDLPGWVLIDPLRFKQVLSNLLSNAIKFTDQGSIHIVLKGEAGFDGQQLNIRLKVEDTGIGISAADQARLFSPFAQAAGQPPRQGTGLGLVISRNLCEMMGGQLTLASAPGDGTCIEIALALPRVSRPQMAAPGTEASPIMPATALNILVVDDYPANLMLLEKQLGFLGHSVNQAKDGEAGLQAWLEHAFDVVITDCNMPVMDGHELARAIRDHEQARGLKPCLILGFTANAQARERERCIASGMDDCLFKPIGLAELSRRLSPCTPLAPEPVTVATSESDFSFDNLKQLTLGDPALIERLLQELARSNQQELQALRHLSSRADLAGLTDLVHKIKGGARMVKARTVVGHCEQIEQGVSAGLAANEIRSLIARLEGSLQALGIQLLNHQQRGF